MQQIFCDRVPCLFMQNPTPSPRPNPPNKNPNGLKPTLINIGWLVVWFLVMTFALTRMPQRPEQVPYSEFLTQVESGQVAAVRVSERRIEYTLKPSDDAVLEGETAAPNVSVTTPLPADPDLPRLLRNHDVEITAVPASNWLGGLWSLLFPLLMLWFLWGAFSNRIQEGPAALSVGKSKARIYSQTDHRVTFDDVAGVDARNCWLSQRF